MPADIVIRGGTVVDGTGAPGRVADVAIADRVIREVGPNLDGDVELDASGCVVAPGFIDIHTHYDAQVFWDPRLRPSSYHGITTVIAGNCGFAIAPTRPEFRDVIVHTLENVEDMDPATLTAGVVWDFETFPEYLDAVQRRGTTLNFTAYVGHSPLRLYVMGDAAYERAATPRRDRPHVCARARGHRRGRRGILDQLLVRAPRRRRQAGSQPLLRSRRGRGAVPRRGRRGQGRDIDHARHTVHVRRCVRVAAARRAAVHVSHVRVAGRQAPRTARPARSGARRGAQVWPQVTPRPLTMQFTMADPYSLNTGRVFGELLQGDRDARVAAYRDPEWRARAAADLEESPMKPRWQTFEVSESDRFPELVGRRVSDLAAERGCGPLDVLCELAVAEDLSTRFRAYIANDDVDAVAHLLTHDHMALGLSDAGAHVDQLCDAPLPTDLLSTWVRERQVMPVEQAVRKLTGEPADMFGFVRRGYLREGNWADVCVFDPSDRGHGPDAARPRLSGRRRTAHRRGADRHATRARERHLDSPRRNATRPGRVAGRPARARVIEPFEIRVDDAVLDDLQRRLAATRLPDEIAGTGWEYGIPYGYLGELVAYWRDAVRLARAGSAPQHTPAVPYRDRRATDPLRAFAFAASRTRCRCCSRTGGRARSWSSST